MFIEYEIDYGNKFKSVLNFLYVYTSNLLIISVASIIFAMFLISFINRNEFILKIYIVLCILLIIFDIIIINYISLRKKYIRVTENAILIRTNCLLTRTFNKAILIKEIEICQKYKGKKIFYERFDLANNVTTFVNWDNLVEVKLKNGKIFRIPLSEPNDFIKQINELIENTKEDR